MLGVLVAGIVSGCVYGLIGLGLTLTFKTSGIFNFGYGALATIAAYIFYVLWDEWHWPLALVLLVVLVGLSTILGWSLAPFARRLAESSLGVQTTATLGILLLVEAGAELLFGVNSRTFTPFLPQSAVLIFGVYVTYAELITVGLSLCLAIGLAAFLNRAPGGIRMRAVVDNPDLQALSGTEPSSVRRAAWLIGSFLVVLSSLLLAPDVGLSASALTSLAVLGFGAAAIGRFSRLSLIWVGGVLIGVGQGLLAWYVNSTSILGQLGDTLPYIVIFLIVLVYPRRALGTALGARTAAVTSEWSVPARLQWLLGICALAVLVAVPSFAGARLISWSVTLGTIVLLLSLGLLVRMSGQISLCHVAFAAVGAVAFSKLTEDAGVPWLAALIIAGLVVVPIGAVIAIPAIRLSGLYLALGTLGLGLLLENMFYQTSWMFGTGDAGISEPTPVASWLGVGSPLSFYYVVLACACMVAIFVVVLGYTRLGRLLRAMSDSAVALEVLGTNVAVTKFVVFGLSAFLAGIAGALMGSAYGAVSGATFDSTNSLLYVIVLVLVVGREPWYALVAAIGVGVIPTYITNGSVNYYLQAIFGLLAIGLAFDLKFSLSPRLRRWLEDLGARPIRFAGFGLALRRHALGYGVVAVPAVLPPQGGARSVELRNGSAGATRRSEYSPPRLVAKVPTDGSGLQLRDVTVRFGGVRALDGLSIDVPFGEVVGLIGPNGAGKTTAFNVCSGIVRPDSGSVIYRGDSITSRGQSWRARHGLGRTFQQSALFTSMTVEENVRLGRESGIAGANPVKIAFGSRSERADCIARAEEAITVCGLNGVRANKVGSLSTGQRRLVELARCLAGDFGLLLLDEPAAGLDSRESSQLSRILGEVVDSRGCGVLLVEHHMDLVMNVCSRIYVVEFGHLLFEGLPEEVRSSSTVQAAYLGG